MNNSHENTLLTGLLTCSQRPVLGGAGAADVGKELAVLVDGDPCVGDGVGGAG